MLNLSSAHRVYLACGVTDLRKSIDGLAALVQTSFGLDPFSPCLFVFCNRQRNKLKILCWEHNGFWVFYHRLARCYTDPIHPRYRINRRFYVF
ncbi:IS66 family insertion sequence element accessory protein TnpB [Paenibacillus alkaliterrae]|uniref:IS66 family insertion sequence element accessory protein TnpB n=1 Tax=Paenibacillus alkaliterrae TaxID=320909 RepID=UPI0038B28832